LKNIVILFSGEGKNLENIIKTLHVGKKLNVVRAISNKKDANGLKRAKKYNIPTTIIESSNFTDRKEFDRVLVEEIQKESFDLVVLAGFMRILTPVFTKQIRAINIHPSLLPLFRGAGALKKSFESDEAEAGVTIHKVNEELDGGEIIAQESFNRVGMSFNEFETRIHEIEYSLYPKTIMRNLYE
jgi:phosphoribosylglycinamide formyltransferase-1